MLAHELGHLTSTDGKLTAALNRLVINPPPSPTRTRGPSQGADVLILADDGSLLTITFVCMP